MEFIKNLLDRIFDNYTIISHEEDFKFFKMKIEVNSIISPYIDENIINSSIISKLDEDILKLYFIQTYGEGGEESLFTYSKGKDIGEFFNKIKSEFENDNLEQGDKYILEINIDKNSQGKHVSIYSIENMLQYLKKSNLNTLLYEFSEVINRNKVCIFNIKDNFNEEIFTNSIYFTSNVDRLNSRINIKNIEKNRSKEIKSRISVCNFTEEEKYPLISNDFNIISDNDIDGIKEVFDKLKVCLAIISICDIASIEDNIVNVTINGYKKIYNTINFDEILNDDTLCYYDIYKWIYNDGEIHDKIGIVRNVISISNKNNNILSIDKSIYESILSSYAIYLKENVERYIEVKEKLNDVLFDLSKKLSDIVNDVGKDFRNNVFGVLTFFITVVLTNSASSGNIEKIFTEDITKLTLFFICGSILYMIFSGIEALIDRNKIKKEISRVKNIYTDILNESDITNIIAKYDFNIDLNYMKSRVIFYLMFWMLFILIICFCMISLSGLTIQEIFKFMLI